MGTLNTNPCDCDDLCGRGQGDSFWRPVRTDKVRDTMSPRHQTRRQRDTSIDDSDFPTLEADSAGTPSPHLHGSDGADGEINPRIAEARSKFREFVTASNEDGAIALVDQNHDIDLLAEPFPRGDSCLHVAVKKGSAKLVLFLLEEGHSVKSYILRYI